MEKRNIEKQTVIAFSTETTMPQLVKMAGVVQEEVYKAAIEAGYQPAGYPTWQYKGCDGNPATTFHLDICLPVVENPSAKAVNPKFQLMELPAMQCVSTIHQGEWQKLGDTYCAIEEFMRKNSLTPNYICREIYKLCDFEHQENCITEVQVCY